MTRPRRRPLRRALPLALALLSAGCIYRSSVKERPLEPPRRYAARAGAETRDVPDRPWWQIFGDPRLEALMRRTLRDSLDLQVAQAKVLQARAALTAARAGWYPSVSAKAEASVAEAAASTPTVSIPGVSGGGASTYRRESYTLSLAAAYEVDLWGKVRYGAQAAQKDLEAAEEDLRAARITLTAQVADAYFLAVEVRSQLKLLDQTIGNRQAQLGLVRRRYREGVVTALDLYQADESLARALAGRTSYSSLLRTTEHAISLMAGSFPEGGISGTLDTLPAAVRALPPGLPAQLLLRRPDLRAAQARLTAADARVGQAVAGHYPSLTLSASLGASLDPVAFIWSVLGGLTAPLFQGLAVQAQEDQRRALLQQTLAAYKAALLAALKDVEDALVTGQMLEQKVVHLTARSAAAEGSLRLAMEQYVQGLTPYLTVLTAEQSVYTARSELLSARRELISARISLARALGGGWHEVKR